MVPTSERSCLIGSTLSAPPLINEIAHGLGFSIPYPGHKVPVELEARAAVLRHESANILRVFITLTDVGISCERVTVPVKGHERGFHMQRLIMDL